MDMKDPMFSVIIPTLNEELFLPKLLSSLVVQTRQNFEVIVVDGSSKDKTVDVAHSFQRKLPRLSILTSEKASLPLQRNMGARVAGSDWFVFIDADSIVMPNFIERITRFIEETNPQLFTTWFRPDSEVNADAMLTLFGNMVLEGTVMFKRPIAPGPLSVVARDAFKSVGEYDENRTFNEDVDLGLRLFKKGIPLKILKETLYIYSFRRIRKQGALKLAQQYIRAALPILMLKRPMRYMPDYVMGGQLYGKQRKPIKRSVLQQYEMKLKHLMKELFE
jgi:glycosyltransferase involved in cell wall biosynthesis